jgi:Ca2+-binding EF-hand superfamily protein
LARFNDWDHNNNGRIEPGEWHGRSDNFRRLDVNRDGWVSRDEFANRVPPSSREEEFAEFDHNNDGRITRDEWHGDIWAFSRLDVDRNNVVTRAEYLRTSGASVPRWHDWDTNGDGRLSAQEWRGHPEMFRRLDLNRDGWLAREEMPYRGGPREREEEFVEIDRNGDGRITIYEWRGERGEFGRVDTNRDGVITPGEFFENLPATDVNDQAYRRGYDRGREEGMAAGREDRENRNGYDLEGQRELEYANSGYDPRVGSIESYQAGYRAGFREGYSTGYNR